MEKIPPQNLEAESSLLGALLIDKEAPVKIIDSITASDFYNNNHGLIYQAIVDLFNQHEPIDILSVANRLSEKKKLEQVGGKSYLAELTATVPNASHITSYANIIRKKSVLRQLEAAAAEIAEYSFVAADEEVDHIMDKAEQKLFAISQSSLRQNFIPIKNVLADAFNRIDELHKTGGVGVRGIPTGYSDLDNLLSGFQNSDLIILAARPSVGKTTLALDLARNVAVRSKTPTGIFSLEMSKEQLVDKLLAAEAGVDLWKMRTGRLSDKEEDDDFPRIGRAMGLLSEAPIFIDDSANSNVMQIRTKARRLKLEHNLGFLIVDYLQLMEGDNKESRVQEISEISRALKQLAKELNIPILALSQLSRAVENRSPAIPKLADLRESGSIEQDADVVMFIYRKSKDRTRDCPEEEKHVAELHIEKHRNGPTGIINLFFDEQKVTFRSTASQHSVPEPLPKENEIPLPTPETNPVDGWQTI